MCLTEGPGPVSADPQQLTMCQVMVAYTAGREIKLYFTFNLQGTSLMLVTTAC